MVAEKEITLDEAIEVFKSLDSFEDYKRGLREVLTRCHTQEDLDRARQVIDGVKERLMKTNPEFKAVMEQRKAEIKRQSDYDRAMHKAKMDEAQAEASRARSEAMAKAKSGIPDIDDFVAKTRVRKPPVENLENKSELWCPICVKEDKNRNIINNKPSCATCWHELVPKSELPKYNRKYRRSWERKKR
jgi:hypothetical protein